MPQAIFWTEDATVSCSNIIEFHGSPQSSIVPNVLEGVPRRNATCELTHQHRCDRVGLFLQAVPELIAFGSPGSGSLKNDLHCWSFKGTSVVP